MLSVFLVIASLYIFVTLVDYWLPLLAARKRFQISRNAAHVAEPWPLLYVLAPCRNAEKSVHGFIRTIAAQNYPADRVRCVILLDAVGPDDSTRQIAESLGAEVFERSERAVKTKGAALNEYVGSVLKYQRFDAAVIFDADARIKRDFLQRVSVYLQNGARLIQGSTVTRNPTVTSISRLGDAVQSMLRQRQWGRWLLGWPTLLMGSHGIGIQYSALKQLQWNICADDRLGDEVELNLRAHLAGIPITFAPDLEVENDVAMQTREVRLQRRRWAAACLELTFAYGTTLLRRGFRGDWRSLELLFSLLLIPPFSVLFVALTVLIPILSLWFARLDVSPWFIAFLAVYWVLHALYYVVALSRADHNWSYRDVAGIPEFIWIRCVALIQGLWIAICSPTNHRWPTSHGQNYEIPRKARK